MLFAMPPQKPKKWTEDEIPYSYEISIKELLEKLLDLEMLVDEKDLSQPMDLPLSPDGKREWIQFHNLHAEETAELSGELAAAWSKLEGYPKHLKIKELCKPMRLLAIVYKLI